MRAASQARCCLLLAACVASLSTGCVRSQDSVRVVSTRLVAGEERRILRSAKGDLGASVGTRVERFRVVVATEPVRPDLVLRVEIAQRCEVTQQLEVRKELITERYVPEWVYGLTAAFVAGGVAVWAVNDDPTAILAGVLGAGLTVAVSFPKAGESKRLLAPQYTPQVAIEDCGFRPHGPHRISYGSGVDLRRVRVPWSGRVTLPGVTQEQLDPIFLDGNAVELVTEGGVAAP